jgi:hypothetical protein
MTPLEALNALADLKSDLLGGEREKPKPGWKPSAT